MIAVNEHVCIWLHSFMAFQSKEKTLFPFALDALVPYLRQACIIQK